MSRRWLQFSLRGFLIVTSAFAVWLGLTAEKARRQKEASALLEGWGAKIDYDHLWQGPLKPPKKGPPPGWPWLRRLIGSDFFDKIVNVELMQGHRSLDAIEIERARKGKSTTPPPRPLVLTDADFAALGHLPDLRHLKIVGELNVSQAGLRSLGRLRHLQTLIVDNTSGRSTGGVTDAGLGVIAGIPGLKTLYLEGNPITDAGLAAAHWPAGLTDLDLSDTRITDAGLAHLQHIPSLRRLVIMDCRVSEAGVADLRKALPGCSISSKRIR